MSIASKTSKSSDSAKADALIKRYLGSKSSDISDSAKADALIKRYLGSKTKTSPSSTYVDGEPFMIPWRKIEHNNEDCPGMTSAQTRTGYYPETTTNMSGSKRLCKFCYPSGNRQCE